MRQKGTSPIIILLVVVILIGIFFVIWQAISHSDYSIYNQKLTTYTPSPTTDTTDWQTHTSSDGEFSIKYPNSFLVEETSSRANPQNYLEMTGVIAPEVIETINIDRVKKTPDVDYNSEFPSKDIVLTTMKNPDQLAPLEWKEKYQYYPNYFGQGDWDDSVPNSEEIISYPAYTSQRNGPSGYVRYVLVSSGGKMYLITVTSKENDLIDSVKQILSTFKLTQ